MRATGRIRVAALLMALGAAAGSSRLALSSPRQDTMAVQLSPDDLQRGKQTFESTCSTCHGLDGGGAMGPNIQGIPFRLGVDAVTNVIKNGMAGGMPAFGSQLDAQQIRQVVGYLLTLSRKDEGKVTGDAASGKQVYASAGCASCHIISGEGGNIGPELTTVGQLRGPTYLRNTLLFPGTDLPQTRSFLESGGMLEFLFVHVVTKEGRAFEGTRVAEDSFHIVLEDAKGKFHSCRKDQLREYKKEPGKSMMPSVKGKLSDTQVNDLVAYLAGLKGAQ
ncbi:MAG TPA: c-type cytochrome [Verrucomicrobiae bacterium]|nr:c-type cytochrome [Verrucomicrobiae bacterium]